jgi:aspartate aminotransferase
MMAQAISKRSQEEMQAIARLFRFISGPIWQRLEEGDAEICDFVFGNPHEMPLAGFTAALQRYIVPQNQQWHAYKNSERSSQEIIAASLAAQRGMPFEVDDILMTNGAFAGLAVVLHTLVNPGEEVIFISPPWFFYESSIIAAGGKAVRVKVKPDDFDLDIEAIRAAITPATRAIIINSPHNPTGKIYPPETLVALARVLEEAGAANGQRIYLISDEAYSRIIFDNRAYYSPLAYYPHSLLVYTYGKTLLTPGERLGYIALSPAMEDREMLRGALMTAQFSIGYAFPNALLQHSLADLEKLSIDVPHLQEKRDWMVAALAEMGYGVYTPEGTFYLLVKSPLEDDEAFVDLLISLNIMVLPGAIAEMPGYFRISLTANDDMIRRALPGFRTAIERAQAMKKSVSS